MNRSRRFGLPGKARLFFDGFDYRPPFSFKGKRHKVIVDVSGELIEDKEARMREVMAHQ